MPDEQSLSKTVKIRPDILMTDTLEEVFVKMAEGNAGAATAIGHMVKEKGAADGFLTLCFMDDMNIRGEQIWVGYKYFCEFDMNKFLECVKNRDQKMIDYINEKCPDREATRNRHRQ